jgi:hypothetical protein
MPVVAILPTDHSMQPGHRDHLITRALRRELDEIGSEVPEEVPLDPAEGPNRLARHAMGEVERALARDESAEQQAAGLNRVLQGLVGDDGDRGAAEVVLPPQVLYGIRDMSPFGDLSRCRLCRQRRVSLEPGIEGGCVLIA